MFGKQNVSPAMPLKIRAFLYFITLIFNASYRSDGTISRRFISSFEYLFKLPQNHNPVNGVKTLDIMIDPTRDLWFRLFIPTELQHTNLDDDIKLPVLIYFHGGAFTFLSPDLTNYDAFCRRLAREIPAVVISVNYRRTPEYRFPSPYDDGFDTLKFLDQRNFKGLPKFADLSRCFLSGESAGGNLAHNVAVRSAKTNELQEIKVIGLITIQPFFGGEERTESEIRLEGAPVVLSVGHTDRHWKMFLPEGSDRDHEACNVFGPKSADISGLTKFPPTLVFVGGYDPLQDWQKRYYEGLKRTKKEARLIYYPNVIHAFFLFPEFPESSLLVMEVRNFIENQIRRTKHENKDEICHSTTLAASLNIY